MKKEILSLFFISCCIIYYNQAAGQSKMGAAAKKIPVALDTLYKIPLLPDELIPGATPHLTTSVVNGYIDYMAWHFRLVFSQEELADYKNILVINWNSSAEARQKISEYHNEYNRLRKLNGYAISNELDALIRAAIWDNGLSGLISADREPTSLLGKMQKAAEMGDKEAKFVINKISLSETELAKGNRYNKPLTQGMADAFSKWLCYITNMVAGKEVMVIDEVKIKSMRELLTTQWIKEVSMTDDVLTGISNEVNAAVSEWDILKLTRTGDFSTYITNYNKLSKMMELAKTAYYYCPSLKPYVEARQKEYTDYANKMTNDEWQLELYRLNLQMQTDKMALSAMKEQQLKAHVINMNIANSLSGDPKYEWVIKEK